MSTILNEREKVKSTGSGFQAHAEHIARTLLGEPNEDLSSLGQLRYGTRGSLAIEIDGDKAGTWYDHEAGVGGGMLDLIVRQNGGTRSDAMAWLESAGIDINSETTWTPDPEARQREEQARLERALYILNEAQRIGRRPSAYLKARGITKFPRNSYFLPKDTIPESRGGNVPCAVFPIYNPEHKAVTACHVIMLNDNADAKLDLKLSKRTFGPSSGGYMKLGSSDSSEPLIVAEGPETALSVRMLTGWPAIATAGAGTMRRLAQIPECSEVVIARDRGQVGREAARELGRRLAKMGKRVTIVVPPNSKWNDWNDVLQEARDPEAVWARAVEKSEEVPWDPMAWTREFVVSQERIASILDAKMLIPGRIPHAQATVCCGEAGSGKTTMLEWYAQKLRQEKYNVIWVNSDLPASDALRAIGLAEQWGYELLLPDFVDGKSMADIVTELEALANSNANLNEHVILLTNLKKMTDLLSKPQCKRLYAVIRRLTAKGGTIVAEAHTNKYPGPDGKLVFEGVGDLKNDFDNLVYLYSIRHADRSRTVSIVVDKMRAPLDEMSFDVSKDRQVTWHEDYVDVRTMQEAEKQRDKDQVTIERITEVLSARKAANESKIVQECIKLGESRRTVMAVLKRYDGTLWSHTEGNQRNAKIYSLN